MSEKKRDAFADRDDDEGSGQLRTVVIIFAIAEFILMLALIYYKSRG